MKVKKAPSEWRGSSWAHGEQAVCVIVSRVHGNLGPPPPLRVRA